MDYLLGERKGGTFTFDRTTLGLTDEEFALVKVKAADVKNNVSTKSAAIATTTEETKIGSSGAYTYQGLGQDLDDYNEVYPGIFIGTLKIAQDFHGMRKMKITHILNACAGKGFTSLDTTAESYEPFKIKFLGIEAKDFKLFNMVPFLQQAADFIHEGLSIPDGIVYVHCQMGRSRSATCVMAYLISYKSMTAAEALATIREHRNVSPNTGFIQQLCEFEVFKNRSS